GHAVLPGARVDRAREPRRDARGAEAGLHRQRAGAGGIRAPHRGALRTEERDDPDPGDDRAALRLDARRHRARGDRVRLAGHRALRRRVRRVVRLPADHGRHARDRPQLHAGELPARPARAPSLMARAVPSGPSAAWLAERQGAVRELRLYARVFARSGASLLGLGLILAFLLIAALGPWIVPYPEDARGAVHLDQKLQPPSTRHWFGTDEVGTDIYTRVVLGARVSLQIGLIITVLATVIGVPLGIIAGYVGGPLGETIMRVTDVFLSVPALVLALAIVGALGPGIVNAILALGLVWWPGYVRLVQSK